MLYTKRYAQLRSPHFIMNRAFH